MFTKDIFGNSKVLVIQITGLEPETQPNEALQSNENYLHALPRRWILLHLLLLHSLRLSSNLRLRHCPKKNETKTTSVAVLTVECKHTLEPCKKIKGDLV